MGELGLDEGVADAVRLFAGESLLVELLYLFLINATLEARLLVCLDGLVHLLYRCYRQNGRPGDRLGLGRLGDCRIYSDGSYHVRVRLLDRLLVFV